MKRLQFLALARQEVRDARHWYNLERTGLGREFTDELDRFLAKVRAHPERYPLASRDIRKVSLSRFPYLALFRVKDDKVIVIAVFHQSRDPAVWKDR